MTRVFFILLLLVPSVAHADRLLDIRALDIREPVVLTIDGKDYAVDHTTQCLRVADDSEGLEGATFRDTPGHGPDAPKGVAVQ